MPYPRDGARSCGCGGPSWPRTTRSGVWSSAVRSSVRSAWERISRRSTPRPRGVAGAASPGTGGIRGRAATVGPRLAPAARKNADRYGPANARKRGFVSLEHGYGLFTCVCHPLGPYYPIISAMAHCSCPEKGGASLAGASASMAQDEAQRGLQIALAAIQAAAQHDDRAVLRAFSEGTQAELGWAAAYLASTGSVLSAMNRQARPRMRWLTAVADCGPDRD